MRITKEDFKKLPQLDRIEFMLRSQKLEEDRMETGASSFFWTMMAIAGFLLIVGIQIYSIKGDFSIINLSAKIATITVPLFFTLILLDLLLFFAHKKKLRALEDEYFKIKREVKVR